MTKWILAVAVLTPVAAGAGTAERTCAALVADLKAPAKRTAALTEMAGGFWNVCPEAVALLLDALGTGDDVTRAQASYALQTASLTEEGRAALRGDVAVVAAVLQRLAGKDPVGSATVVTRLLDVLAATGPSGVPFIADQLGHVSRDVRWTAALELKELGPDAKAARPALQARLKVEKDADALAAVREALAALGK